MSAAAKPTTTTAVAARQEVSGDDLIRSLGAHLVQQSRQLKAAAAAANPGGLGTVNEDDTLSLASRTTAGTTLGNASHAGNGGGVGARPPRKSYAPSIISSIFSFASPRRSAQSVQILAPPPPSARPPPIPTGIQVRRASSPSHAPSVVSTSAPAASTMAVPSPGRFTMDPAHLAYLESRFRSSPLVREHLGLPPPPPSSVSGAAASDTASASGSGWGIGGWFRASQEPTVDEYLLIIFKFLESLRMLRVAPLGRRRIADWAWPPSQLLPPSSLTNVSTLEFKGVLPASLDLAELHLQISTLLVQASIESLDQALAYSSWTRLALLDLSNNCLARLDATVLARAPYLTDLVLQNNGLVEFPDLRPLVHLAHLDLSFNRLTDAYSPACAAYAEEHGQLPVHDSLQRLNVHANAIASLETVAAQFPNLGQLVASKNQIVSIPPLAGLASLGDLQLWGNPIAEDEATYRAALLAALDRTDHLLVDGNRLAPRDPKAAVAKGKGRARVVSMAGDVPAEGQLAAVVEVTPPSTPSVQALTLEPPSSAHSQQQLSPRPTAHARRPRYAQIAETPAVAPAAPLVLKKRASSTSVTSRPPLSSSSLSSPTPTPVLSSSPTESAAEPVVLGSSLRSRKSGGELDAAYAEERYRQRVESLKKQGGPNWMKQLVQQDKELKRRSNEDMRDSASARRAGAGHGHGRGASLGGASSLHEFLSATPPSIADIPSVPVRGSGDGLHRSSSVSSAIGSTPAGSAVLEAGESRTMTPARNGAASNGTGSRTGLASGGGGGGGGGSDSAVSSTTPVQDDSPGRTPAAAPSGLAQKVPVRIAHHTKPASSAAKAADLDFTDGEVDAALADLPLASLLVAELHLGGDDQSTPARVQLTFKASRAGGVTYTTLLTQSPETLARWRAALDRQVRLNVANAHYDTVCPRAQCLLCHRSGFVRDHVPKKVVAGGGSAVVDEKESAQGVEVLDGRAGAYLTVVRRNKQLVCAMCDSVVAVLGGGRPDAAADAAVLAYLDTHPNLTRAFVTAKLGDADLNALCAQIAAHLRDTTAVRPPAAQIAARLTALRASFSHAYHLRDLAQRRFATSGAQTAVTFPLFPRLLAAWGPFLDPNARLRPLEAAPAGQPLEVAPAVQPLAIAPVAAPPAVKVEAAAVSSTAAPIETPGVSAAVKRTVKAEPAAASTIKQETTPPATAAPATPPRAQPAASSSPAWWHMIGTDPDADVSPLSTTHTMSPRSPLSPTSSSPPFPEPVSPVPVSQPRPRPRRPRRPASPDFDPPPAAKRPRRSNRPQTNGAATPARRSGRPDIMAPLVSWLGEARNGLLWSTARMGSIRKVIAERAHTALAAKGVFGGSRVTAAQVKETLEQMLDATERGAAWLSGNPDRYVWIAKAYGRAFLNAVVDYRCPHFRALFRAFMLGDEATLPKFITRPDEVNGDDLHELDDGASQPLEDPAAVPEATAPGQAYPPSSEEYYVDKILDSVAAADADHPFQYHVSWYGYPPSHNRWNFGEDTVPTAALAVAEFHAKHPTARGRRSPTWPRGSTRARTS
ncbi:Leucine-rich repeat-containing protein 72 [Blastocladiella emersonii ATCC 22665]|nr:Leucine-rich repeat-containing protein 72 [Blastocladiella emersonii ATCC 22665]